MFSVKAKPVAVTPAMTTPSTMPVKSRLRKRKTSRTAAALADSSTIGAMTVAPRVSRAGRVGRGGRYPAGREAVGDDRYQRRRARAPGEGEHQVAPGPRLDPVEPAEGGDEQRHRQHRETQPDQEALGAGLFAHQREDDQPGQREQGDQRRRTAPTCAATSARAVSTPSSGGAAGRDAAGYGGYGGLVATASTLTREGRCGAAGGRRRR